MSNPIFKNWPTINSFYFGEKSLWNLSVYIFSYHYISKKQFIFYPYNKDCYDLLVLRFFEMFLPNNCSSRNCFYLKLTPAEKFCIQHILCILWVIWRNICHLMYKVKGREKSFGVLHLEHWHQNAYGIPASYNKEQFLSHKPSHHKQL